MNNKDKYVRIWNERSTSIGGVGGATVIQTLKSKGFDGRACESEFKNHDGIEVPVHQIRSASRLIEKRYGREG